MTTKQLKRIRSVVMSIISLVTIILFTVILKNLPDYFDECKMLLVTSKIIRALASITLLLGVFSFFTDYDHEDSSFSIYFLTFFSGFYEVVFAYFYLRARIFGYHHLITYCDNLGLLLSILSLLMIIVLSLVRFSKYRRILFENESWRNEDNNSFIEGLSGFGIKFCLVMLIVIFSVEGLNKFKFKPSGEENGFSYIDLKLPSGVKWANQNFFSKSICDLGTDLRWGQTTSQLMANSGLYDGEIPFTCMATSDDIVSELMGGDWYIPTQQDWEELISECKARPSYYNGVYGITIKKPYRLKRLFIPTEDIYIWWRGTPYWTSTVIPETDMFDYELVDDYYDDEYQSAEDFEDCNCEDCNCRCHRFEDELDIEDEEEYDDYSIEAAIATLYSIESYPNEFVQMGQSFSYNKCYIRPVIFQ